MSLKELDNQKIISASLIEKNDSLFLSFSCYGNVDIHNKIIPFYQDTIRFQDVSRIFLSRYNDSIPFTPEDFPNLQELRLKGCFTKLDTAIKNFKNLQRLTVNYQWEEGALKNEISIPDEIGELKNLKELVVKGNLPEFPASITKLKNLKKLELASLFIPLSVLNIPNIKEFIYYNGYIGCWSLHYSNYGEYCLLRQYIPKVEIRYSLNYPREDYIPKKKKKIEIKDGSYELNYNNGNLAVTGYIKNGLIDSTWIFYLPNGDTASIRNYQLGEKQGKWSQYIWLDSTLSHGAEYIWIDGIKVKSHDDIYVNDKLIKKIYYPINANGDEAIWVTEYEKRGLFKHHTVWNNKGKTKSISFYKNGEWTKSIGVKYNNDQIKSISINHKIYYKKQDIEMIVKKYNIKDFK